MTLLDNSQFMTGRHFQTIDIYRHLSTLILARVASCNNNNRKQQGKQQGMVSFHGMIDQFRLYIFFQVYKIFLATRLIKSVEEMQTNSNEKLLLSIPTIIKCWRGSSFAGMEHHNKKPITISRYLGQNKGKCISLFFLFARACNFPFINDILMSGKINIKKGTAFHSQTSGFSSGCNKQF